jgi:phosphoenolpyruvate carboxylase
MSDVIKEMREHYQKQIRHAQQALITLAETCPHDRATKTARADTGNYSRSDDRYWWQHVCPDCGRAWETPQ